MSLVLMRVLLARIEVSKVKLLRKTPISPILTTPIKLRKRSHQCEFHHEDTNEDFYLTQF